MLTLCMHSMKEKQPNHKDRVVFIRTYSMYGIHSATLDSGDFFYHWIEIDVDGYPTGNTAEYHIHDEPQGGWELGSYIQTESNSITTNPNTHWMLDKDYWKLLNHSNIFDVG